MLRFKCPKCGNPFSAEEAQREGRSFCPHCGQKVRLRGTEGEPAGSSQVQPAKPMFTGFQPAPPREEPSIIPIALEKPASLNREASGPAEPPIVEPIDLVLGEDSEEDAPSPLRRSKRRRKKKPRDTTRLDQFIPGVDNTLLGFCVVGFLWMLLVGLSLLKASLAFVLFGYGIFVVLYGVLWMYGRAIEDGLELLPRPGGLIGYGMIFAIIFSIYLTVNVAIFLFYMVIYIITNPARAWKPLVLLFVGWLIVASGILLLRLGPGS